MSGETWYRVFFKTKNILVYGEAELARIQRRKVPKVLIVEEAVLHKCSVCDTEGPWDHHHWAWLGSHEDIEENRPVQKFCSALCRPPRPDGPMWDSSIERGKRVTIYRHEPTDDFGATAWARQGEAKRMADVRRFPMPIHGDGNLGNGWCRWCGVEILDRTGKNRGKRSKLRTWCRHRYGDATDCWHEYCLHTDRDAQERFLLERDGPGCAIEGCVGRWVDAGAFPSWMGGAQGNWIRWSHKCQVDHIIPLWKVYQLPPDELREYHGPDNLWLLCDEHHKRKSALEAAERAALL